MDERAAFEALTDILPCPFHKPYGPDRWPHPVDDNRGVKQTKGAAWLIECPCGVTGPSRDSKADAIAAWNLRAAAPATERAETCPNCKSDRITRHCEGCGAAW